ncbi:MAG: hypothetical protein ACRD0L_11310, partial [Acidimicrobiales bacterium]
AGHRPVVDRGGRAARGPAGPRGAGDAAGSGGSKDPSGGSGHAAGGSSRRPLATVRVLPDVPALGKAFDYVVPEGWEDRLTVGSRVRVALGRRRVRGWVIEVGPAPLDGVALRPLAGWSGRGPAAELVDLARWAAWRWAGRQAHFLSTASPQRVVLELPATGAGTRQVPLPPADAGGAGGAALAGGAAGGPGGAGAGARAADLRGLADDALAVGRAVVRLAPAVDALPLVEAVLGRRLSPGRSVLVLVPSAGGARAAARRLQEHGWPVALLPDGWPLAAAGGRAVVGTRAGAWAPAPGLAAVVVLDAHDEAWQGEQAPTWVAWEVAAERAERAETPCLLVSPCPTLDLLARGRLVVDSRSAERAGWPVVEVVDRRRDDPRGGLFSDRLVALVRSARAEAGGQVVCVLNRTGRARLLACGTCGELARCECCGGPMAQPSRADPEAALVCRRCGAARPALCACCGSERLKVLRAGTARVRDELEALAGLPVEEVSGPAARRGGTGEVAGSSRDRGPPEAGAEDGMPEAGAGTPEVGAGDAMPEAEAGRRERRDGRLGRGDGKTGRGDGKPGCGGRTSAGAPVVVGTEAVLHRLDRAAAVAFLDMDQELLASGFRAGEAALALLARAARLVGGRGGGGRLLVQTRLAGHEVLAAAVHADPGRLSEPEAGRRVALRLPPASALALVSGAGAEEHVAALGSLAGATKGVPDLEIRGPDRGAWLVRAVSHRVLCDALAAVPRTRARLRVEVDPRRA